VLFRSGASQKFAFRRGGKDSHGGSALYGYVRMESDTALVSKYYSNFGLVNVARDSGYYVRADAVVLNEVTSPLGVAEKVNSLLPVDFSLSQNYPNPFNPSTTVQFALPRAAKVSVVVYDILGREVIRLVDGEQKDAGYYRVQWDSKTKLGMQVATGVYLYRIQAGSFVETKKMMLLK
jgi:pullulanase/glycogen debranching enzyme